MQTKRIRKRFTKLSCAIVVSAILIQQNSTKADLLAYEGFDYSVGNLAGNNGGTGWAGAWALNGGNTANSQIIAGSFSYIDSFGHSLVTSGNSAFFTGDGSANGDNLSGGSNASASPLRILSSGRGNSGLTESTWVSFLALRTGTPSPVPGAAPADYQYSRAAGVQFFYNATAGSSTAGNEQFTVGRGTQSGESNSALPNDTWSVLQQGNANATIASSVQFANAPVDFILIRIDHVGSIVNDAANADTLTVWINPTDLNNAPNDASADIVFRSDSFASSLSVNRDWNFDRIRLFAGNDQGTLGSTFTYGSMEMDEFRIGTAFGDVTPNIVAVPEPAMISLFGVGTLFLVNRFKGFKKT